MSYLRFFINNLRFLAFGFLLIFLASFGQTFIISLFADGMRAEFGLSHGAFGNLYMVGTLTGGLCMFWLGRYIDKIDLRLFTALTCIGYVLSCALLAAAPSALFLTLAFFGLRLTGQGLMAHASMTSMARYFEATRGRAIGIANLGFPAGQAIFPVAVVVAAGTYGWRETWAVVAGGLALVLLPSALWLLKGHTDRHRLYLERLGEVTASAANGARQWTRAEALRDPLFYLLMPALMAPPFFGTGLFFHQVHLVAFKGWSLTWFATSYFGFALAWGGMALLSGPMIDRFGAGRFVPFYLGPFAVGLVLLSAYADPIIAPIFMVAMGTSIGLHSTVVGALWAEIYGVANLGAIRSLIWTLVVFSSALSPAGFGWLLDAGIDMNTICLGGVVYLVVGSALGGFAIHGRFGRRGLGKSMTAPSPRREETP